VRRGEKGIAIFAPCRVRKIDDETGEEESRLYFKVVHVFDVSQTEGDELPTMEWPVLVDGPTGLFDDLVDVARRLGLSVATTDSSPNGARGWYEPSEHRITIVDGYPAASRARTMLHELGHAFDPACHGERVADRAERELVAESVAYIVGKRLGLDTDDCSTLYAASWGAEPKQLEAIAERVLDIARRLEEAITAETAREEVA
jgi:antirestriction protein ArdC